MLDPHFVLLAALLNIIGCSSYALATWRGQTEPNQVSWFLWAVIPLIAFAAQVEEGVGLSSLMTFMVGFGPMVVFLVSFSNRMAIRRITWLDVICGGLSVAAVCCWQATKSATVALVLSIVADGLAGIPTLVKSLKEPETEHYLPYLLAAVSGVITLLTITKWTFAAYAFPLYILVFDAVLFVLIRFQPFKKLDEGK